MSSTLGREIMRGILGAIEWKRLFAREVAVGMRFDFPRYELITLFRVDPEARSGF